MRVLLALATPAVLLTSLTLLCSGPMKPATPVAQPIKHPWLRSASASAASIDIATFDPCDWGNDLYQTLRHLNDGMNASPDDVQSAWSEQPALTAIVELDEVERWRTSWRADLSTDASITAFLMENGEYSLGGSVVPQVLSLSPAMTYRREHPGNQPDSEGTWSVHDGLLTLQSDTTTTILTLRRATYFLVLDGNEETWAIAPRTCYD